MEILTYYEFKPTQFPLIYVDLDENQHAFKELVKFTAGHRGGITTTALGTLLH